MVTWRQTLFTKGGGCSMQSSCGSIGHISQICDVSTMVWIAHVTQTYLLKMKMLLLEKLSLAGHGFFFEYFSYNLLLNQFSVKPIQYSDKQNELPGFTM